MGMASGSSPESPASLRSAPEGRNAHLVVEEYRASEPVAAESATPCVIVLSARNAESLKQIAANLHRVLCDGAVTHDLAAIAYTLQVGREAMDERLAFMASSLDELKAGLQAFLHEEEPHGETLYCGQVERHKETLALFAADEDMATAINAWIAKGKYEKLLELWVKGLYVDWYKLWTTAGISHYLDLLHEADLSDALPKNATDARWSRPESHGAR